MSPPVLAAIKHNATAPRVEMINQHIWQCVPRFSAILAFVPVQKIERLDVEAFARWRGWQFPMPRSTQEPLMASQLEVRQAGEPQ